MRILPLAGWQIRRDGQHTWQTLQLPGCWEEAGFPKDDPGPFDYRVLVVIPDDSAGRRLWLRFGACSYACQVWANGQLAGEHTGMWDPFRVEITRFTHPGEPCEIVVRVEKPASLTAGPDSAPVAGKYPLRQTLAGFLPYVWGHAFGGLWQPVDLEMTGPVTLMDACLLGGPDGRGSLSLEVSASAEAYLEIASPGGEIVLQDTFPAQGRTNFEFSLPNPQSWEPARPRLYSASLAVRVAGEVSDRITQRFGLRALAAQGSRLRLNGQTVYPRLALSWGWYPEQLCPNPGKERIRQELLRLRSLDFNGVKLCLWFPPEEYFELADELGMLLWLELPLWIPQPGPGFEAQVFGEVERLVRVARRHPSVVLYTLGCELDRSVSHAFLGRLYHHIKILAPGTLARDNSGSGEAYGGHLQEWADFYDNHFYCDLQFLEPIFDGFSPRWRQPQPWLMGEFGDYDTLRDIPALTRVENGRGPWWLQRDPGINPQGARWEMRVTEAIPRLKLAGLWEKLPDLVEASHQQGLLHRKMTLERTRLQGSISGYVLTGEADTPVSTAGLWDDFGRLKFSPGEFTSFNEDTVILLGGDRQRAWVAGGDRLARRDLHNHFAGEPLRFHLIVSHYGKSLKSTTLHWEASLEGQPPYAAGDQPCRLVPGETRLAGVAEFFALAAAVPVPFTLSARLVGHGIEAQNSWPMWVYPRAPLASLPAFTLIDPLEILPEIHPLAPRQVLPDLQPGVPALATLWTPEFDRFIASGGQGLYLHSSGGPLPTRSLPYWREAVKWTESHPAWGDFPHNGSPSLQFYSLAPDQAFDLQGFSGEWQPLLRRLDTRGFEVQEYLVDLRWGAGRLLATTLRLQGGAGDQPTGLRRSPAAQYLLACLVRFLESTTTAAPSPPG